MDLGPANGVNFDRGIFGRLHQNTSAFFGKSPDLTQALMADGLDTHFNVTSVQGPLAPTETDNLLVSDIPDSMPGATNYSFGDSLQGVFSDLAPRGDLTTPWALAQLVVFAEDLLPGAANPVTFKGDVGGSDIGDSFDFTILSTEIPEPATMSLLAIGGVAALIRRRK